VEPELSDLPKRMMGGQARLARQIGKPAIRAKRPSRVKHLHHETPLCGALTTHKKLWITAILAAEEEHRMRPLKKTCPQ